MTLDEWLSQGQNQNLKRVAELFAVNHGRMDVQGNIGEVLHDPKINRYGRLGLTIIEAFELTYMKGVIDGFIASSPNQEKTSKEAFQRVIREVRGQMIEIPTPEQKKLLLGGK
mgnify:CR=1 FL=1